MFFIGAIKPIAIKSFTGEYEIKPCFITLRYRFGGGNKNFIQKKGETNILTPQVFN